MEAVERRAIEPEDSAAEPRRRARTQVDAIAFYLASGFRHLDDDDESAERWDVNFFSKALKALP